MLIPEANNGWQLLKKAKKLKGPGWILKPLENGKGMANMIKLY